MRKKWTHFQQKLRFFFNSSYYLQLWIIFPKKYSQDNCVAVLRTEIFKAMVKNVHLLTCIYIKIALLKVGNNFLNKDFIFLQGRS